MNTAISATRTGAWEDTVTRTIGPIPPRETGNDCASEGGSPARVPRTGRVAAPCAAVTRPGARSSGGPRTALCSAPPRRNVAPEPADMLQRARVGFAATTVTSLLTAAVVTGILALAHLRAPEPPPAPPTPEIPAVSVPGDSGAVR